MPTNAFQMTKTYNGKSHCISGMTHHTFTMTTYWTKKQCSPSSATSLTCCKKSSLISWCTRRSGTTTGARKATCLRDLIHSTRESLLGGVTGSQIMMPPRVSHKVKNMERFFWSGLNAESICTLKPYLEQATVIISRFGAHQVATTRCPSREQP